MATKTVTLTGAELCVDDLGGLNALIVNNTDAPLYASAKAGVTPYADGVIEIKAGATRGLPDTNGTVYLLGNGGRAELTGTSAGVNFSVPSSSSEGGGGITRDEVNEIVTDKIAEVVANAPADFDTLREIADWIDGHEDSAAAMNSAINENATDISDILAEQQTQNSDITTLKTDMKHKADISNVSNPNLLDNPDFRINQRGQSEYKTASGTLFTVDRWLTQAKFTITKVSNGIECMTNEAITGSVNLFSLRQLIEAGPTLWGKPVTMTVNATKTHGLVYFQALAYSSDMTVLADSPKTKLETGANNITTLTVPEGTAFIGAQLTVNGGSSAGEVFGLEWVKLEPGNKATPFVPPHPALELLKCQRYYQKLSGKFQFIGSGFTTGTTAVIVVPVPTTMRTAPTVSLNGTLYINTTGHQGENAIPATSFASPAGGMPIGLPLKLDETVSSVQGYGAAAQFRDNDSYLELSADL